MSKLTKEAVERVLAIIRTHESVERSGNDLWVPEPAAMRIHPDGRVWFWGASIYLPLDWTDRRRIVRAAHRRHKALTDDLIQLGERAKREGKS